MPPAMVLEGGGIVEHEMVSRSQVDSSINIPTMMGLLSVAYVYIPLFRTKSEPELSCHTTLQMLKTLILFLLAVKIQDKYFLHLPTCEIFFSHLE
jgi:hypothetical protein